MRRRGVRLDLFICMLLAAAVFYGVWFVGSKLDFSFDKEEKVQIVSLADAEVGLGAGEDIPRVTSFEELCQYMDCFTIEMPASRYYNYGTYEGYDYVWRAVRLDDDTVIPAIVNENSVQDTEDYGVILPIGTIVEGETEVLDEMVEDMGDKGYTFITDAYIDMNGEADSSKVNAPITMTAMMLVGLVPLVLFVVYILLVFGIHAIFCKLGIFPPVFNKKKSEN